jgi:hypothetical protein
MADPRIRFDRPDDDQPAPEVIENERLRRENEERRRRVAASESATRSAIRVLTPYAPAPRVKHSSGRSSWTAWTYRK